MEGGGGDMGGPNDSGFGTAGDGTDTGADAGYGGFADAFGDTGGYSVAPQFSDLSSILDGIFGNPDAGPMSMDSSQQSLDLGSLFSDNQSNEFSWGKLGKAMLSILSMVDKTGVLSQANQKAGLAFSNNPGKATAQAGLATLAGMVNPALGFAVGLANKGGLTDSITSQFGNTVGLQGGQPADGGMSGMMEGLAGMYAANRGMNDSGKMLGSLQSLYSQDSPYAQAMRQNLQRRDAAGGRRSQYGPREVELQAKLAQMASSQIPAMSQLQQRQNINRAIMMQQGLGAFNKMGGLQGLKDLFGMGGMGGLFDRSASDLVNGGSLGNLFSLDPFQNSMDQSWIPEYDPGPWGG